jgi:hypothetical protein
MRKSAGNSWQDTVVALLLAHGTFEFALNDEDVGKHSRRLLVVTQGHWHYQRNMAYLDLGLLTRDSHKTDVTLIDW